MLAILQPFIPHYREEFFERIKSLNECDIFCYEDKGVASVKDFKIGKVDSNYINNISVGPFLLYNPFKILSKKYSKMVLMLHFGHITTWLLLLFKIFHKKKIILWGQGISVKRYLSEEVKPNILLKWMISLSDGVWFYTEKELNQWRQIFPGKEMISLNNTITGIDEIVEYSSSKNKSELKAKYNIEQEICFIFCARFNNNFRRQDLLIEIIKKIDTTKYGFVIIGEGPAKPNFSSFKNVYDFGSVYDKSIKQELFSLSDLYIQPGWVGLSVVEAMGYGKPIVTFRRSREVLQCVEYHYLIHGENSLLFNTVDELIMTLNKMQIEEINKMGEKARKYVKKNLSMEVMVTNAQHSLK